MYACPGLLWINSAGDDGDDNPSSSRGSGSPACISPLLRIVLDNIHIIAWGPSRKQILASQERLFN